MRKKVLIDEGGWKMDGSDESDHASSCQDHAKAETGRSTRGRPIVLDL